MGYYWIFTFTSSVTKRYLQEHLTSCKPYQLPHKIKRYPNPKISMSQGFGHFPPLDYYALFHIENSVGVLSNSNVSVTFFRQYKSDSKQQHATALQNFASLYQFNSITLCTEQMNSSIPIHMNFTFHNTKCAYLSILLCAVTKICLLY